MFTTTTNAIKKNENENENENEYKKCVKFNVINKNSKRSRIAYNEND